MKRPFRNRDKNKWEMLFDSAFLPDDGQEFLKPGKFALAEEKLSLGSKHVVWSFDKADRAYEKKEYDEAAKLYYVVARECDCLSARLAWGVALVHVSELRRAEEAFDTGLTLALKGQAPSFIIAFGLNGAQVKSDLGKMGEAAKKLESSMGMCSEPEVAGLQAPISHQLAMLNFRSGKFGDALRNCERAKEKYKELGDHRGEAMASCTAGMVKRARGELSQAGREYGEAIQTGTRGRTQHAYSRTMLNRAILCLMYGQVGEAVSCLNTLLRVDREENDDLHLAKGKALLGMVIAGEKESEGLALLVQGIELVQKLGYKKGMVDLNLMLARQKIQKQDYQGAWKISEKSLQIATEIEYANGKLRAHSVLGFLLAIQGNLDDATEAITTALSLSSDSGNVEEEINATRFLATIYASQDLTGKAKDILEDELAKCRDLGYRMGEVEVVNALAMIYEQGREMMRAAELKAESQAILQSMGVPTAKKE